MVYLSFPITKFEETPAGHLLVHGCATDGSLDSDDQIVDADWSGKAVEDWLKTGGNVRVMHNAQRDPAGVGVEVDLNKDGSGQHWVKSLVVDASAKELVKHKALRAYSVGISRPKIVRDSKARNGRIVGGEISEISLVDRPANKSCGITLVKADSNGNAELVEEIFGDTETITKIMDPLTKADSGDSGDGGKPAAGKPAAGDDGSKAPGDNGDDDDDDVAAKAKPAPGDTNPTDDDDNADDDAVQKEPTEPEVAKAGKDCPKCGRSYHADAKHRTCESCGASLPAAKAAKAVKPTCTKCNMKVGKGAAYCSKCGAKVGGSAVDKGKPTVGTQYGQSKPVPAHREPDGDVMETFEGDAGMEDGDGGAARRKSSGAGESLGHLHDLLCYAMTGNAAEIPAAINITEWAEKAVAATTLGDLEQAGEMLGLMGYAKVLKDSAVEDLVEVRAELAKGFSEAYPDVKLTPGTISPGQFQRIALTDGHARLSTGQSSPTSVSVPTDQIEASDFERGPLTGGHAAPSPGNVKDAARPSSSMPARTFYTRAGREAAMNAMVSMHDHIARTFPSICPMASNSPNSIKDGTVEVPKIEIELTEPQVDQVTKAEVIEPEDKVEKADLLTKAAADDLIKSYTADLFKSLGDQIGDLRTHFDDQISELRRSVEEMAAEPDPRQAPWRGVAVQKNATATPVERRSLVDEAAARSREQLVLQLQNQARNSTNPAQREEARSALKTLLGT